MHNTKVYGTDADWNDVPANYIFAMRDPNGRWWAIYIGETGNLQRRMGPGHEKWDHARMHGMTHIHAHTASPYETDRQVEERDLIASQTPLLQR
ncbi:MAG: hypothetical protein OXI95_04915 [bacterium]|nr:hypothetical protein [bacterium]